MTLPNEGYYTDHLISTFFFIIIFLTICNVIQEYAKTACNRILSCGHPCRGIKDEDSCLPCLHRCGKEETLKQDADDMCMICFTEALSAAPAIQVID